MPIPVCKFGRAHFHKYFKPEASYGKCPSKKEIYYGFKLHATIALDGFITNFTITSADIDDRVAIWDLTGQSPGIIVIGDKGYIGDRLADALKSERHISLISLKRSNSKIQFPKTLRQEEELKLLSLNFQRVLAKSKWGFISRITNKILDHNLCFFIKKLLNSKMNPAKIKQLLFG